MKHKWKRMTKAYHAHTPSSERQTKREFNGISPNVVTITVYFIRPIRDLVLCERFAFSFHSRCFFLLDRITKGVSVRALPFFFQSIYFDLTKLCVIGNYSLVLL